MAMRRLLWLWIAEVPKATVFCLPGIGAGARVLNRRATVEIVRFNLPPSVEELIAMPGGGQANAPKSDPPQTSPAERSAGLPGVSKEARVSAASQKTVDSTQLRHVKADQHDSSAVLFEMREKQQLGTHGTAQQNDATFRAHKASPPPLVSPARNLALQRQLTSFCSATKSQETTLIRNS